LSYVDAFYNKDKDIVQVVERINGKRVYNDYPAWRTFYVKDPRGDHVSIYGDKVRQIKCKRLRDLHKERKINAGKTFYESDMKPEVKCLSEHYNGIDSPTLNTAFFDIETDFDANRGFADPSDPFMPITAISVHLQWLDLLVTLVIPPKSMRSGDGLKEAERICEQFDNTELYLSEADMLNDFLDVIEDADVLTGWNSEGYDIPYTVNRITSVLSKSHTRKLCLWDLEPKTREVIKYGKKHKTFDLFGRIHLDYLELYRKYTYHEMHSYALDTIGDHEVGEKKVAYDGTLDQLYNNDFYKFVEYNRQDVALLDKIDKKLRFIELANEIAHDNTVNIKTTMGAVAVTEQAIINEAHRRGMVVPDRKSRTWSDDDVDYTDEELYEIELQKAAGAFVAVPKAGLQRWVAGVDINSLYPSVIRAMNMSPETIAGQLRPDITEKLIGDRIKEGRKTGAKTYGAAQAWDETFSSEEFRLVNERDKASNITLVLEDAPLEEQKTTQELTGAEAYDLIFNSELNWTITANGTIFKQDIQGIIPSLLERWYAERQIMQQKKKEAIKSNDAVGISHWDKRQLVKKINLNSLYGALLNKGCRFYDKRIGQSTTLTGRCITRHMGAKCNEVIVGKYDYKGPAIIYGDTDSIYYSMYPVYKQEIDDGTIEWNKDKVLALYDEVTNQVNDSFPEFMKTFFNVPRKEGEMIVAGRENCSTMGIFIKKKRYALLMYDDDGVRRDVDGSPGKVKVMGIDIKRSDTPAYMQNFLSKVLLTVLTDGTCEEVIEMVKEFKKEFRSKPGWEKGSQTRVNNLTSYKNRVNASKKALARDMRIGGDKTKKDKVHLPGHVSAALNWNMLRELNQDRYAVEIVDGMKCIICKLKPNTFKLKSVAYPVDATKIPQWFQDLPFDHDLMEQTIVDKKLDNLIGVLNWDMSDANASETFDNLFDL
jgi:DNA polymerase elongation subunit (family B)